MRYSILNPTGNITALVEDDTPVEQQPLIAEQIMKRHQEVEQVGFVCFTPQDYPPVNLRMAGGEFCGNATMCAAALFAQVVDNTRDVVCLNVSGTQAPVAVRLSPASSTSYLATVDMPPAKLIKDVSLALGDATVTLPLVCMDGISHAIITSNSEAFSLLRQRRNAEGTVRAWCDALHCEGLGLMFLERRDTTHLLTPLVYIPGSNTVFWENSCASGSAAVGMYLSYRNHFPIDVTLCEPGGELRVESDWSTRKTVLHGSVSFV